MSGICAVWHPETPERISGTLGSLNAGLLLEAPERSSQWIEGDAGVAVSSRFAGQQIYHDGQVLLACDAELLNEKELAIAAGVSVPTTAAVLAALYERFGTGFVEKLRGAFSLVLFDRTQKKWLAAIDGFGIKRLAYYRDEKVFCIASRVDALARCGAADLQINPRAIANVLNFSANLAPETVFTKVQRIIPGAVLVVSSRQVRIQPYWDMRYDTGGHSNEARLSRELELIVEHSVADHCKDYPIAELGAYLSGGTDSSTVLGMMTRATDGPVKSFSIGYHEEEFNELDYAEIAARRFQSEHHTYLVGSQDCLDAMPRIIRCFDEPFGNSSAIHLLLRSSGGAEWSENLACRRWWRRVVWRE